MICTTFPKVNLKWSWCLNYCNNWGKYLLPWPRIFPTHRTRSIVTITPCCDHKFESGPTKDTVWLRQFRIVLETYETYETRCLLFCISNKVYLLFPFNLNFIKSINPFSLLNGSLIYKIIIWSWDDQWKNTYI